MKRIFDWKHTAAAVLLPFLLLTSLFLYGCAGKSDGQDSQKNPDKDIVNDHREILAESVIYSADGEISSKNTETCFVDGYDFPVEEITREDMDSYFEAENNANNTAADRVRYFTTDGCIKKYIGSINKEPEWSVSLPEGSEWSWKTFETAGSVLVYGHESGGSDSYGVCFMRIDDDGTMLWHRNYGTEFWNEWIWTVIDNEDGSFAIASREGEEYFCLRQCDANGNITSIKKTKIGDYLIYNVFRGENSYYALLQASHSMRCKLLKTDFEGNVINTFTYDEGEWRYRLTDVYEKDGKLYLSLHTTLKPKIASEYKTNLLWKFIYEHDPDFMPFRQDNSHPDVTQYVKDNYTAVLLVCNAEDGSPIRFYSSKESISKGFSFDESGNLNWHVMQIGEVAYYSLSGIRDVYGIGPELCYIFDQRGMFVSSEKQKPAVYIHSSI